MTTQATLRTLDGVALPARWWNASGRRGTAAVLAHGFTGSKDDAAVGAVAESLRADGHDVLSYDSRGHGGSGGLCTLGDLERLDVAAAVALVRERAERIVVVGASMGAIAVLRHAAADPDLAGVVAVSSPAGWRIPRTARTALAAAITRTPAGRRLAARRMGVRVSPRWTNPEPPRALAARITVPIAVVHGSDDRFVRPSEAAEIAEAATAGRCRLGVVSGMGHGFDPVGAPAIRAAVEWILDGGERPVSP